MRCSMFGPLSVQGLHTRLDFSSKHREGEATRDGGGRDEGASMGLSGDGASCGGNSTVTKRHRDRNNLTLLEPSVLRA